MYPVPIIPSQPHLITSENQNRPGEEQIIEDHAIKLDETEGILIGKCPMSSSKKRFMNDERSHMYQ